jgi:hypothetical protein
LRTSKAMSGNSDTMKKLEKIESTGQQEETFKQDTRGIDMELSKRVETERERDTKRLPTGARSHVF